MDRKIKLKLTTYQLDDFIALLFGVIEQHEQFKKPYEKLAFSILVRLNEKLQVMSIKNQLQNSIKIDATEGLALYILLKDNTIVSTQFRSTYIIPLFTQIDRKFL
jgi:hypothetical protein